MVWCEPIFVRVCVGTCVCVCVWTVAGHVESLSELFISVII